MDKESGMTFEEIEDCFPEGACDAGEGRGVIVSAQWLHDFARNVSKWQREQIADQFAYAIQSDLENGVKILNESAANNFKRGYPALNELFAILNQVSNE